jgi:hypothetical protein
MGGRRYAAGPVVTVLVVFLAWLVAAEGGFAAEPDECATPAELMEASAQFAHLAARLAAHQPAKIVAIGGASTIGQAAGSPDLSFPHQLQQILAQDYPKASITVVNKGVPRQSARQNLDRFPTDVFAEDPVLVIWETGINDAVRGTDVDDFAGTLQSGTEQLKNRAIDIILVDMQFSKSATALINFEAYLKALHRVGDLAEVYVLPRYEMMRYWSDQNVFNFDEVAPENRAKLATRVYTCIAYKLAQVIRRAAP